MTGHCDEVLQPMFKGRKRFNTGPVQFWKLRRRVGPLVMRAEDADATLEANNSLNGFATELQRLASSSGIATTETSSAFVALPSFRFLGVRRQ
eukprot:CAMPEP_0204534924 /NCGR_PEP_ID=MMETSP0661-20131031/13330_1 /ASSEMBLY_ACC=CAM_ASM_000606 /TAXON_ID=109239 /ORGANISM="Alexandrium margalefi, Strain AMGDE01CS-322" /LENGTH=92 /DNA_ID=CAMNT_0051541395 /DNA_START=18 /DNA_END=293 /DNA_ORIENTATION=-